MTPFKNFSKNTFKSLQKGILITSIAGSLLFTSCGGNVEYAENSLRESVVYPSKESIKVTKGVITTVEEVSPDKFRITDEQVIEDKAASKVIANYMDGKTDTLSLAEVQGDWSGGSGSFDENGDNITTNKSHTSSDTTKTRHYRRSSGIGSIVMYGYMGYLMGRRTSPNPAVYKNSSIYNRVSNTTGKFLNTVTGKSSNNTATRRSSNNTATRKSSNNIATGKSSNNTTTGKSSNNTTTGKSLNNTTTGKSLNNTATRSTVSKPSSGTSGYGSSKSTRSYGG